MWAMPFGFGLTLFADDLVDFVLGAERWSDAVVLLQISGVTAAIGQSGLHWGAYYRARGETRPLAVASVGTAIGFMVTALPLLFLFDLTGYAIGLACHVLVALVFRGVYLARLFHGFSFIAHIFRALAPVAPAAAVILVLRTVIDDALPRPGAGRARVVPHPHGAADAVLRAPAARGGGRLSAGEGVIGAVVALARPLEWLKNALVLAPLLFAGLLSDGGAVLDAGLAFVAFCLISSAGYAFNDTLDAPLDRDHPREAQPAGRLRRDHAVGRARRGGGRRRRGSGRGGRGADRAGRGRGRLRRAHRGVLAAVSSGW